MQYIRSLTLHRRDGRQLPGTDIAKFISSHGWKIDKIVAASWEFDGVARRVEHADGIGVHKVTGDRFLAISFDDGPNLKDSYLSVVNSDASTRFIVPNTQVLSDTSVRGLFRWMEDTTPKQQDAFCGVFEHPNGIMFRIEIDAVSGETISIRQTR